MRRLLAAAIALSTFAGTSLPVAALACNMRQQMETRCCCPEGGEKTVLRPDCCKVVERSVQRTSPLSQFPSDPPQVPALVAAPLSFVAPVTAGLAPSAFLAPAQRAAGPPTPLRI